MRKHGLATREFVHYINSVQAGGTASTSAHADGTGGCIHIGDDNPFFDNGFIVVMGFFTHQCGTAATGARNS